MRHAVAAALALGLAAVPLAGGTQQAVKTPRIGVLGATSAPTSTHLVDAFRRGLREHGRLEGQNIVVEYRYAGGRIDQPWLSELVAELIRLKIDVIVTQGTPLTRAANQVTTTIPIVMVGVFDPLGSGFVASLARPGGNVTGLTNFVSPELSGKWLELLTTSSSRAPSRGTSRSSSRRGSSW